MPLFNIPRRVPLPRRLARLRRTSEGHRDAGGISYMALGTCFGDMTYDEALQAAELLATEVMPYLSRE
jgi:hypothetical protein